MGSHLDSWQVAHQPLLKALLTENEGCPKIKGTAKEISHDPYP